MVGGGEGFNSLSATTIPKYAKSKKKVSKMAKVPTPPKKKVAKSAVAPKVAVAKASAAEAKASRGPVAPKVRYPKMSTAQGASEAAKRGAGAARSAMGGFGKTAARPMISNEGKAANQAARRKAIAGRKSAVAKAEKNMFASAPTPSDRLGSKKNVKRAANAARAKVVRSANVAAKKQKSLAVGRAKAKMSKFD